MIRPLAQSICNRPAQDRRLGILGQQEPLVRLEPEGGTAVAFLNALPKCEFLLASS
jgi:hypothetical protein